MGTRQQTLRHEQKICKLKLAPAVLREYHVSCLSCIERWPSCGFLVTARHKPRRSEQSASAIMADAPLLGRANDTSRSTGSQIKNARNVDTNVTCSPFAACDAQYGISRFNQSRRQASFDPSSRSSAAASSHRPIPHMPPS
jgi:hypothetical protein